MRQQSSQSVPNEVQDRSDEPPQPVPEKQHLPRFRKDLSITRQQSTSAGRVYVITDPKSGEHYEFDEQAFFLFQSLDGILSATELVSRFNVFFGKSTTIEELFAFLQQASETGLLEDCSDFAHGSANELFSDDDSDLEATPTGKRDLRASAQSNKSRVDPDKYRWTLFDPQRIFHILEKITRPFRVFFLLLSYSLFVGLPLALFTFFDNQHLMSRDLALLGESRSYFGRLIFTLLTLNVLRCLIQGTVCTYYGGTVRRFGIRLRFGIIPRFFVDKSSITKFDRGAKLWSWGSNLLFRLVLIVVGVLTWYVTRGSGTELSVNAIILCHAALISFILISLPFRAADGYRWMVTYFRLPLTLFKMALGTLVSTVTGRQLPTTVSAKERRRLLLYAVAIVTFWTYAFIRVSSAISAGLVSSFPEIFGEATEFLVVSIVVILILRWGFWKFSRTGISIHGDHYAGSNSSYYPEVASDEDRSSTDRWSSRVVKITFITAIVVLLALPYPYRPGGEISLLPPAQQSIQAPVSGKVVEVYFSGGDGRLVTEGTMVAKMVASEVDNLILTLQERIQEQQAEVDKQHALLDKLVTGPRSEEIKQAQARVDQAIEEMNLAERQLQTAQVASEYSDSEVQRVIQLSDRVISQLDIERAKKQADIDRFTIKERESNLAAKKKRVEEARAELEMLIRGAHAEDIEAARQDVESARAELRRLKQEMVYAQAKEKNTRLLMPFDGYLADPYLNQKIGSFLNVGETFAIAEIDRKPMAELILPEYDVAEIQAGSIASIKLLAYPDQSLSGEVLSIEPSSSEQVYGQTFRVLIKLPRTDLSLRTGMSGYGKIEAGTRTLFFLLTRPLIRFFEIEVWSWVP